GEGHPPFGAAIDDRDRADAGRTERDGDALAHRPGADDGDAAARDRPVMLDRQLDRGMADRGGATRDRRLGAGTFADADGPPEQQVERGASAAFALCDLPGLAELAEDLGLADDD